MSELKSCPFCGSEVYLTDYLCSPSIGFYCTNNECIIFNSLEIYLNYFGRQEAIDKWNTRTSERSEGE